MQARAHTAQRPYSESCTRGRESRLLWSPPPTQAHYKQLPLSPVRAVGEPKLVCKVLKGKACAVYNPTAASTEVCERHALSQTWRPPICHGRLPALREMEEGEREGLADGKKDPGKMVKSVHTSQASTIM